MSTQLDRRLHARRAAAPSLDFSLLPASPDLEALMRAAEAEAEARVAAQEPPVEPPPPPTPPPHLAPSHGPVPERFRYRARPVDAGTLQPFEVPEAHAMRAAAEDDAVDAAEAFLRAHLEPPRRRAAYTRPGAADTQPRPRPSEVPTLILETPRRSAAPTLEPTTSGSWDDVDLEAPRREGRLDTDLLDWLDSDESDSILIDDPVDPDLDAWQATRSRQKWLAGLGVAAAIAALGLAAVAGLVVLASPVLDAAPERAPVIETSAPPPAPAAEIREVTVTRGDTLSGLLADLPVDAMAIHAAARPHADLARLEIGDTLRLVMDPSGSTLNRLETTLDDGRTLVVRRTVNGWTGAVE